MLEFRSCRNRDFYIYVLFNPVISCQFLPFELSADINPQWFASIPFAAVAIKSWRWSLYLKIHGIQGWFTQWWRIFALLYLSFHPYAPLLIGVIHCVIIVLVVILCHSRLPHYNECLQHQLCVFFSTLEVLLVSHTSLYLTYRLSRPVYVEVFRVPHRHWVSRWIRM